ncbi:MAG: hypothetical protein LBH25_05665 [Fibromonadaceae bacterium]|jgi:hypothetical protein|nr:hypothetical protein [Fibromonadaceae bacterium]
MRLTTLLLISFCVYSCKEEAREKEYAFELNRPEAGRLGNLGRHHLGGGLCVVRSDSRGYWDKDDGWPEQVIKILSCYDSLPLDTTSPTKNVIKYKQGGLCFCYDCSIEPENSFTVIFMDVPEGFIGSKEYDVLNILASGYSDSAMLYRYLKRWRPTERKVLEGKVKGRSGGSIVFQEMEVKATREETNTITFFSKRNEFWEELFSIAKPLKVENDYLIGKCDSEFCSTKDILNPLYEIICLYGKEKGGIMCYPYTKSDDLYLGRRIDPKCFHRLRRLSEKHGLLMHSGAFPVGDCDLGNWRYVKIDSLNKEYREKLKSLLKPPDSIQVREPGEYTICD